MHQYFFRKLACQDKSVYNCKRGGVRPIFTNAFLEQMRNILKNLFLPKVLYVTKGCLKKLARAKNEMRAQKNKSRFLDQLILTPPKFFSYVILIPNQACRGPQNSMNRDPFQYLTPKHDVHTSGTFRAGFADF